MRLILLSFTLAAIIGTLTAQVPLGFSFQTIIRDSEGKVQKNQSVSLRFSILEGNESGADLYSETHSKTTNDFGVINLTVGTGTPTSGSFSSIVWGSNIHFLKTEIDPTGGSSYSISTTSQLMSVPYAMYAQRAENLSGTNGLPGQHLVISNNGVPAWTGNVFPDVRIDTIKFITPTSAQVNLNLLETGEKETSQLGVVFSTLPTFTESDSIINHLINPINDTIKIELKNLNPSTTYFVRGFGTNSLGTGYSNTENFTTSSASIPILTTNDILNIEQTSVSSGGNIISNGGYNIISKGLVWSESSNPSISNNNSSEVLGLNYFTGTINNLSPNTLYYLRAYAENEIGIGYGEEKTFTTLPESDKLVKIILDSIGNITTISGRGYVTISNEGGGETFEWGVVWRGCCTTPTVNDNIEFYKELNDSLAIEINELNANREYIIRAFAINNFGISYSNELVFTTEKGPPILLTSQSNVSSEVARIDAKFLDNGSGEISECGFVWSLIPNPSITDSKIIIKNCPENYHYDLTDLTSNSTYYVKAFAKSEIGITYGNELNFTTTNNSNHVLDLDGNIYYTIEINDQVWMSEDLKVSRYNTGAPIPYILSNQVWTNAESGAWCYYNNSEEFYNGNFNDYFGKLYNGFSVKGDSLCPFGWHIPTNNDWNTLFDNLGGQNVAGGKLKQEGFLSWSSPNTGATNEKGFTALGGGSRSDSGNFGSFKESASWWSYGEILNHIRLEYGGASARLYDYVCNNCGEYVRCIKD